MATRYYFKITLIKLIIFCNKIYAGLNIFKWGVDHFKKCHAEDHPEYPNVFFGQIGHGTTDHNYWGRPEEMEMKRPAYILTRKSEFEIYYNFTKCC